MKFENRVAVVTGGAGRIGRAAAEKFCEQGVAVALADISIDKAEAVAANLREKGGNVRAYVMDVEKTESVQNAAKEILRDFARGHSDQQRRSLAPRPFLGNVRRTLAQND